MKTFILDLIPKIIRYSEKLDHTTLLTNKHWVLINEESNKTVYIFRESNNQLLVAKNGKVEKGRWEYLGNSSILIDQAEESFLLKHEFMDDTVLALKIDGGKEYALFVNEHKFEKSINSINKVISFLEKKYLTPTNDVLNTFGVKNVSVDNSRIEIESKPVPNKVIWKINPNLKYTFKSEYPENEFKIYNQKGNWGYIDKDENVVIDFVYEDAFPFSEGLAVVQLNGKKGFIDRHGKSIIDFQFDSASYFKNGKSTVSKNGEKFEIDKLGNKLIENDSQ